MGNRKGEKAKRAKGQMGKRRKIERVIKSIF
jgi:hypothetical protein